MLWKHERKDDKEPDWSLFHTYNVLSYLIYCANEFVFFELRWLNKWSLPTGIGNFSRYQIFCLKTLIFLPKSLTIVDPSDIWMDSFFFCLFFLMKNCYFFLNKFHQNFSLKTEGSENIFYFFLIICFAFFSCHFIISITFSNIYLNIASP